MSILLGPYDKEQAPSKPEEEEDLLVFGYACKLYRDDVKASLESSGQLLIPWMGDSSLMVDRYDVRNRFDDKSQFGVKSNLPYKMSAEEEELEDQLDRERYLALHWDDIRVEEQEEEEKRRALEHSYHAIRFSYNKEEPPASTQEAARVVVSQPRRMEHPPSCSVDTGDGDVFVLPEGLVVPEGIKMPATAKLHSIIEKTALFTSRQGQQMEIIIKAKQKFNPFFSFLNMSDPLYPYYSHVKTVLSTGTYVPPKETTEVDIDKSESQSPFHSDTNLLKATNQPEDNGIERQGNTGELANGEDLNQESDEDSGSESDDDGYLHPLLMRALNTRSKSSTPTPTPPPSKEATPPLEGNGAEESNGKTLTSVASVSFRAKSMVVNAAPVLRAPVVTQSVGKSAPSSHTGQEQQYGSYPYPGLGQEPHGYNGPNQPQYHDVGGYHHQPPPPHMHESHYPPHPHTNHYHHPPQSGGPNGVHPGQYDYEAYYTAMSAIHIQNLTHGAQQTTPTTAPPTPDLQPIIDKMAEYVVKNGDNFEMTVIKRHAGDSRFNFLNPWDEYHPYYMQQKQRCQERTESENENTENSDHPFTVEKTNVQRLSSSGSVSFKLQPKSVNLAVSTSVSHFEEELDGSEELVEDGDEQKDGQEERNEEAEPLAKKQRLEDDDDGSRKPDQIGSRVQEFLVTVKSMFREDGLEQSDT